MKKAIELTTIKQLKNFEIVDPNVSKKYVPIFTSELIELLKPEFTFIGGLKFRPGSSAHYVNLSTENGDVLRLYNSYDRELALKVSFVSEGVSIPLGIDRLIHMGTKAKNFTEEFTNAKQEILDAVKTAKVVDTFMKNTTITKDAAETITEAIFTLPKAREMVSITNPVDVLIGKATVAEYIKKSIRNYLTGEYQYTNESGKTVKGPRNNTIAKQIETENKVIKALKEINPELFL